MSGIYKTVEEIEKNVVKFDNMEKDMTEIFETRRSGHYAPILLAPAEGWGPFGPWGPCWGPSAPSRVAISKL